MIAGLPEEEFFAQGHRACAGCGEALAVRTVLKAAGENSMVVSATGCMEVVSTPYPQTAWRVPWCHGAFENAAAIASGIDASLKAQGKREGINLLALAGDGGTFDIGFQALSGAIERGHNFLFVCTDNSAYMNTGIQRSSATPRYAATTTTPAGKEIHGKIEWKKPFPFIIAAHKPKYVATASVANLLDFYNKVKKAFTFDGPSYIQVFCPCPVGWQFNSNASIQVAKVAIESRVSPLYEIVGGVLSLTVDVKSPKPVDHYLKLQGRFKHLGKEEIKQIQAHINQEWTALKHLAKTKTRL